ncbi:lytic polysaccharide monooxygenase [Actinoplanes sp. NPDC051411]|uniref:lytic polysaccharide monooxygenase n=1 Tax=Actinoplanes sp. NPDC051411 TaxID=3155522 RepID=UPI0034254676
MRKRSRLLVSAVVGALVAAIAFVGLPATPASAHGNVISPASRNYGCFTRWGDRFQDPAMATEDPMCYQAWQADPNAMWNWNGLYREQVAGNHQAAIPDGELCSAGHTQSGRYNAMDTIGDWKATTVGNSFTVQLFDQALHGADYVWVYVSNPGFNPRTQALKWSDLTRVAEVGKTPASQWIPVDGGVRIDLPVALSGRTGRAMVYTIWQASHMDQSYYFCSDIDFGGSTNGGGTTPPPTPTTSPTTPPASGGACSAAYSLTGQWQGGFQGDVKVTAGAAAIKGWTVRLTFSGAVTVTQSWNATTTASGTTVTASNASYNGALAAAGSTTFGLIGTGTASTPTVTCTAT